MVSDAQPAYATEHRRSPQRMPASRGCGIRQSRPRIAITGAEPQGGADAASLAPHCCGRRSRPSCHAMRARCRIHSPVASLPIRAPTWWPLSAAGRAAFSDFRYHRTFVSGNHDVVLVQRQGGRQVAQGIDMIHFDDEGRIAEFEVMVRPASGLQALGQRCRGAWDRSSRRSRHEMVDCRKPLRETTLPLMGGWFGARPSRADRVGWREGRPCLVPPP